MDARTEALLRIIEAAPDYGVPLSNGIVAERLQIGWAQARWLLRRTREQGLVEATARFLPNGGQVESLYALTDAGRAFLARRKGGEAA